MDPIGILLLVPLVLSALLLILLVLVQDEQGEGIAGIFSGSSSSTFGSRTGNVLTRFTTVLAAVFLFCCFGLAWINRTPEAGNVVGAAREQALSGKTQEWWVETPASPAPGQGTTDAGTSSGSGGGQ